MLRIDETLQDLQKNRKDLQDILNIMSDQKYSEQIELSTTKLLRNGKIHEVTTTEKYKEIVEKNKDKDLPFCVIQYYIAVLDEYIKIKEQENQIKEVLMRNWFKSASYIHKYFFGISVDVHESYQKFDPSQAKEQKEFWLHYIEKPYFSKLFPNLIKDIENKRMNFSDVEKIDTLELLQFFYGMHESLFNEICTNGKNIKKPGGIIDVTYARDGFGFILHLNGYLYDIAQFLTKKFPACFADSKKSADDKSPINLPNLFKLPKQEVISVLETVKFISTEAIFARENKPITENFNLLKDDILKQQLHIDQRKSMIFQIKSNPNKEDISEISKQLKDLEADIAQDRVNFELLKQKRDDFISSLEQSHIQVRAEYFEMKSSEVTPKAQIKKINDSLENIKNKQLENEALIQQKIDNVKNKIFENNDQSVVREYKELYELVSDQVIRAKKRNVKISEIQTSVSDYKDAQEVAEKIQELEILSQSKSKQIDIELLKDKRDTFLIGLERYEGIIKAKYISDSKTAQDSPIKTMRKCLSYIEKTRRKNEKLIQQKIAELQQTRETLAVEELALKQRNYENMKQNFVDELKGLNGELDQCREKVSQVRIQLSSLDDRVKDTYLCIDNGAVTSAELKFTQLKLEVKKIEQNFKEIQTRHLETNTFLTQVKKHLNGVDLYGSSTLDQPRLSDQKEYADKVLLLEQNENQIAKMNTIEFKPVLKRIEKEKARLEVVRNQIEQTKKHQQRVEKIFGWVNHPDWTEAVHFSLKKQPDCVKKIKEMITNYEASKNYSYGQLLQEIFFEVSRRASELCVCSLFGLRDPITIKLLKCIKNNLEFTFDNTKPQNIDNQARRGGPGQQNMT